MDPEIVATLQKTVELLRAKEISQAQAQLFPLLQRAPETAEAWFLLGFTYTDPRKKMQCFLQVLRIDPNNEAARKQIIRLTSTPPPPVTEMAALNEPELPVPAPGDLSAPAVSSPSATSPQPEPLPVTPASPPEPAPTPVVAPPPVELPPQPVHPPRSSRLVTGISVGLGLLCIYLLVGLVISLRVGAVFAGRNCNEVARYNFLKISHPQLLFSPLYGAYRQLGECQARLEIDQALGAQNWESAYRSLGDYLEKYPEGVFAAEYQNQIAEVLMAWNESLVAQENYMGAIQELFKFQERFPNSPKAPQLLRLLYDDYLRLVRFLLVKQDYEAADRFINLVLGDRRAAPDQQDQARQLRNQLNTVWKKP